MMSKKVWSAGLEEHLADAELQRLRSEWLAARNFALRTYKSLLYYLEPARQLGERNCSLTINEVLATHTSYRWHCDWAVYKDNVLENREFRQCGVTQAVALRTVVQLLGIGHTNKVGNGFLNPLDEAVVSANVVVSIPDLRYRRYRSTTKSVL